MRKDLVEIPAEITEKHHNFELCMDTMFVNECRMLTTINRLIQFQSVIMCRNVTEIPITNVVIKAVEATAHV